MSTPLNKSGPVILVTYLDPFETLDPPSVSITTSVARAVLSRSSDCVTPPPVLKLPSELIFQDELRAYKLDLTHARSYGADYPFLESLSRRLTFQNGYALRPYDYEKDRYSDVLCYGKDVVMVNGSYINASRIDDNRFIATQGPLHGTKLDFWNMIIEQGSNKIVALVADEENGKEKCVAYWNDEKLYLNNGYTLEKTEEIPSAEEIMIVRKFSLSKEGIFVREIIQFHDPKWAHFGTRPPKEMALMQKQVNSHQSSGPLIVHCSAGIGRTGTWLLPEVLFGEAKAQIDDRVRLGLPLDLADIKVNPMWEAFKLRSQRKGMVQTKEQYAAAVECARQRILEYASAI